MGLKSVKLLDVDDEHDATANGTFDRIRNERPGRRGFERHHVHQLLSALAVVFEEFEQGGKLRLVDADPVRRVAFPQKATGRADDGEFEPATDKFIGDPILVSIVNNAYGELHCPFIIRECWQPW